MELRHLRYFVAVAEEQNVTRAAARLHVSQPPLSRQVRDLEGELGVALFEHGARSVRLTPAGRVFLTEARAVLRRADQAVRAAQAAAGGQRAEIHFGYAPSLTASILPPALRRFARQAPEVRVHLHDLSTAEMRCGLREGRLHAALMVNAGGRAPAGLQFTEMLRLAVRIAMAPTHRLARAGSVRLEQLAGEPLVVLSRDGYPEHHDWIRSLFARLNRRPVIAEEHDSSTSLIAAVEAGAGIALTSTGLRSLAGRRLVFRAIRPAPPDLGVVLAHRDSNLPAVVQDFVQAVLSEAPLRRGASVTPGIQR